MNGPQKRKNLRFLLISIALLAWACNAGAQDKPEAFVVDKIIAKVDNYVILKSELEGAYQNYLTDGNPPSEQAKCDLLNRLIINKLLVAKAEIDSVIVTTLEVDNETEQLHFYLV